MEEGLDDKGIEEIDPETLEKAVSKDVEDFQWIRCIITFYGA